ncbi:MAG: 3' terminal RNA ribose 2'-O-methyltransferase Hen1, partial [Bacteroidota bacterium]
MQLSIICRHSDAQDLSYLLHKHPDKLQSFRVPAGKAFVFYPRYEKQICMVSLLLEINPLDLYKKLKRKGNPSLLHYVNDRPYVGSSFTSTALAKVFSSALNGKCESHPDLPQRVMDFEVKLPILKIKGNSKIISRVFAPLNYEISAESLPLDPHFPQWGLSNYYRVNLKNRL